MVFICNISLNILASKLECCPPFHACLTWKVKIVYAVITADVTNAHASGLTCFTLTRKVSQTLRCVIHSMFKRVEKHHASAADNSQTTFIANQGGAGAPGACYSHLEYFCILYVLL